MCQMRTKVNADINNNNIELNGVPNVTDAQTSCFTIPKGKVAHQVVKKVFLLVYGVHRNSIIYSEILSVGQL